MISKLLFLLLLIVNSNLLAANETELEIFSAEPFTNQVITSEVDLGKIRGLAKRVNINTAQNQYSTARLLINAKNQDFDHLTISFESEEGKEISEFDIDFRVLKEWYQAGGAWTAIGKPTIFPDRKVLVPELLLNDEGLVKVDYEQKINYLKVIIDGDQQYFSVSEKTPKTKKSINHFLPKYKINHQEKLQSFSVERKYTKQIWITIKPFENTQPAEYNGKVVIRDEGSILGEIDIMINVLPIYLPEPSMEYAMYYHGRLYDGVEEPSVSAVYKTEAQLMNEFIDMREHGIKYPVVYQDPFKNINLFVKYLELLSSSGLEIDKLYMCYLNTNNAFNKRQLSNLEKKYNLVESIAEKFGVKHLYVYGIDEAKGDRLTKQKKAWEKVQQLGGKTFVAGYQGTFELMGERLDILVFAQSPMTQEALKYHSIGKKIFNYANPQVGVESPYIYRKNYGVQLWASGFDGAMLYAYQHFMGDGWNDYDHPIYRDHNFVYSATDSIVSTIAWEGFRAGVNDVRYITLLETLILHTMENKLSPKKNLALQAKDYLARLKKQVNEYNRYGEYTKPFYIDLNNTRREILGYISGLSNKPFSIKGSIRN